MVKLEIIDISRDDEYYTQINNRRFPFSACNVTSGIMWLLSNLIAYFHSPTEEADDDYFMSVMRSRVAYEHMERVASWTLKDRHYQVTNWEDQEQLDKRYLYPPSEVWQCLEWGINRLAGKEVCELRWNATFYDLLFELVRGRTVLTGGKWTKGGHFNVTVGLTTEQTGVGNVTYPGEIDVKKIHDLIVDDPYGNFNTGYKDHRGNSVRIPIEKYLDHVAAYRHPAYKNSGVIWGFFKKTA